MRRPCNGLDSSGVIREAMDGLDGIPAVYNVQLIVIATGSKKGRLIIGPSQTTYFLSMGIESVGKCRLLSNIPQKD